MSIYTSGKGHTYEVNVGYGEKTDNFQCKKIEMIENGIILRESKYDEGVILVNAPVVIKIFKD